jgi:hypothetical protein
MTNSQLSGLASALDGKVELPGQPGFDQARGSFNLALDQRPAAVVFPESAQDVAAAVRFADESGQHILAQGTGHNGSPLGSLDNTILLKMERMREVMIDPDRRVARAEAGAPWQDVTGPAAQHGLAALAGSSPGVDVVGYTLGGGLSLLGRKYGLAASHVQWFELVTSDGSIVRADRDHEGDLFWAMRGGGGSFGIVTAMGFELFPLSEVYAGTLWYPMERGSQVLQTWRDMVNADPPDEFNSIGRLMNFPPVPQVPEAVRGKSFATVETFDVGDRQRADELLAPLRDLEPVMDTMEMMRPDGLGAVHMDPAEPMPFRGDGLLLAELPAGAVDAFVQAAAADVPVPLVSAELRMLGGELGRDRPGNGALPALRAHCLMYCVGLVPEPRLEPTIKGQVQAVQQALGPWAAADRFLNLTETAQPAQTMWSAPAFERLQRIKAAVDPRDILTANHPVPPARLSTAA